ncbi:hypothetical protein [Lysinibacillus xylanilyticus]|uniref:hypothetical protein n=1 Tax=Lysinibacillus xylanilyticus TaxID=582475 RepID=UPI003D0698CB
MNRLCALACRCLLCESVAAATTWFCLCESVSGSNNMVLSVRKRKRQQQHDAGQLTVR